jgi:uncharacterized phage protein (TIGR02218 family)
MSGRQIPIALADALREPTTHDCRIWKLMPRESATAPAFGLTSLNQNVVFDDGSTDGEIMYSAFRGYVPYAVESTADLAVDNSEMEVLLAEFEVDGFTSDAIRRGVYDGARFIEYLVDYTDLSKGKVILQSGKVGRILQVDNMVCFPEVRSLTQTLKQKSIIELGSNNCRATMGDERCGYDVESLWVDTTVTSVGLETDREFTIDGDDVSTEDDFYVPGMYEFYTGANAGRTYEVEAYVGATKTITFAMPTEEPITTDDTGRVRDNCTNLWGAPLTDDHKSCEYFDNRPKFRGEPKRPVSETSSLMASGAGSPSTGADTTATDPT